MLINLIRIPRDYLGINQLIRYLYNMSMVVFVLYILHERFVQTKKVSVGCILGTAKDCLEFPQMLSEERGALLSECITRVTGDW